MALTPYIDFNQNISENISDTLAICLYDDFKILYNKETQYFNATYITTQLNPSKKSKVDRFI